MTTFPSSYHRHLYLEVEKLDRDFDQLGGVAAHFEGVAKDGGDCD